MIVAQISDPHISLPGSSADVRWNTATHLEAAVAHLAALDPVPDLVVVTGDCVDGGKPDEYERLRGILERLPVPFCLAMGNHDDRDAMRSVFGDTDWMPRSGFVHYAVDGLPVRLIVLDTHVPREPGGTLCAERLAWLRERLSEAPERPTLLFLHHPPFATGSLLSDSMGLDASAELGELVQEFGNVELVSAGHVHRPIQRRFFGSFAMTCPSTSHQAALELQPIHRLAFIDEPPAALLHYWSETTGVVTHVSYIRDYGAEDVVYDGERWLL